MNILLETTFERLLSKYERTFGEPPPFTTATAEEVIRYMRRRLDEENHVRLDAASTSDLAQVAGRSTATTTSQLLAA